MHTGGGSVKDGSKMISAIKSCPVAVATVNMGFVGSMGVPVFASAAIRLAATHSWFMLHGAAGASGDDTSAGHKNDAAALDVINQQMAVTLAEVMKNTDGTAMTAEQIIAEFFADGLDHYLTAQVAVDRGLATGFADFSAENIPAAIESMNNMQIAAHFGYDDDSVQDEPAPVVIEAVLEECDRYRLDWVIGSCRSLINDAECLADSKDDSIVALAAAIAKANAAFMIQLVGKRYADENVAAEMLSVLHAQMKGEADKFKASVNAGALVPKAELTKIEAQLSSLNTELATAKTTADTATADLTAKATELTAATTRVAELEALIPGAKPQVKQGDKQDNVGNAEAEGWEKYLTPNDKKHIAEGKLKIN
jgi:ATP-dependent protease ClpP protease subunit